MTPTIDIFLTVDKIDFEKSAYKIGHPPFGQTYQHIR
jgi:hypothetical protein